VSAPVNVGAIAHAAPATEPPTLAGLLGDWHLGPPLLLMAAGAVAYLVAARVAGRAGRPWPARRSAAFLVGLALLAVSLASGVHRYGETLLSLHMVQHLAMTLVAVPLLLLGAPVTLILRMTRGRARRAVAAAVASPPVRALASPLVAWPLLAGVMLVSHLTGLYDLALRSPLVHDLEHAGYLLAALLFWSPVVGADPGPRAAPVTGIVYILLAMAPMGLIGATLMSAPEVRYPAYESAAAALGTAAIADQRLGAAVMWVGGGLVLGAAGLLFAWRAVTAEEERAVRRERYSSRPTPAVEPKEEPVAADASPSSPTSSVR
jgi:cytochrome c oxidase assembly factor CtaG